MPVFFDEACYSSRKTPESERDDQPDSSTAVVGKKTGKYSRQRVKIIEDWTCHNLVEQATSIMRPFTHLVGGAIDISGDVKTEGFVVSVQEVKRGRGERWEGER